MLFIIPMLQKIKKKSNPVKEVINEIEKESHKYRRSNNFDSLIERLHKEKELFEKELTDRMIVFKNGIFGVKLLKSAPNR